MGTEKSGRQPIKIGTRINYFVVIEILNDRLQCKKQKYRTYKCLCDCGIEFNYSSHHLRRRVSCGCKQRERRFKNVLSFEDKCITKLFRQYIRSSRQRKIDFSLEYERFVNLIKQDCFYCKDPPSRKTGKYGAKIKDLDAFVLTNGIDRYDNSKGYTIENSKPCCFKCNVAKSTMTVTDFYEWIKRIYRNFKL